MNESLRQSVRDRAGARCEYCHLPEEYHELPFQLEHIIARKHRGTDESENLAWACYNCNAHKGPNIAGIDPQTQLMTRLFHPRLDRWEGHFVWVGAELLGKTEVGRATVEVLEINREENLGLRRILLLGGEKLA